MEWAQWLWVANVVSGELSCHGSMFDWGLAAQEQEEVQQP